MKTIFPTTLRTSALALVAGLCLQTHLNPARAAQVAANPEFPYVIPCEPGTSAFAPGDRITISSVKGNRAHLEPGGAYLVQGSYTLASAENAELLFSCTTRGPSGPTPISDGQELKITRGSGTFLLKHTTPADGWFHVSFYVAGHSHGGIYFGEKDVEETILRKMDWPDFSNDTAGENASQSPGEVRHSKTQISTEPNRAIMAYLGDPVPPPADLNSSYAPTQLEAAFTALSKQAGLRILKLMADDSEFPYLVYGRLAGKHDFRELEKALRAMKGYDYGGSVVGSTEAGATYFALNMIPQDQYPSGRASACNRRLVVRLQMLADAARREE
jgi:hypothetical protein